MSRRALYRLERRLMLAFAIFALGVMALFTLYALAFAYTVEDEFFVAELQAEAQRQVAHHRRTGNWLQPRDADTDLHHSTATFPDAIRDSALAEPNRTEWPADDGRHYHLFAFKSGQQQHWLLAEVSQRLVFRRMRPQVITLLGSSALLALAVATLLGWVIARRTTLPLARLVDAVAALDPQQLPGELHFSQLQSRPRHDEVALLARGLDSLVARVHDFLEREVAFTRDVSHELRTPLAVIVSVSAGLSANASLGPKVREQLTSIQRSAAQLETTIVALLSLAREQTVAAIAPATPLLPILERVLIEQAALHSDPALEVTLDVPSDTVAALPAAELHIVLSNLVGNAFHHAERGEFADIARRLVDIRTDNARFCIRNYSSVGLDPSAFTPFQKRPGSSGLGLGLGIAQRLCARYGIVLETDQEQQHARVWFWLSKGK